MATTVSITVAAWRISLPSLAPRPEAEALQLITGPVRRELVVASR